MRVLRRRQGPFRSPTRLALPARSTMRWVGAYNSYAIALGRRLGRPDATDAFTSYLLGVRRSVTFEQPEGPPIGVPEIYRMALCEPSRQLQGFVSRRGPKLRSAWHLLNRECAISC